MNIYECFKGNFVGNINFMKQYYQKCIYTITVLLLMVFCHSAEGAVSNLNIDSANTPCAGTSTQAQQGSFSTGYTYSFQTTGNTVNVTFRMLDTDKPGVVGYLWKQTAAIPFNESGMTAGPNLTFTQAVTGLAPGSSVNFAAKFAYAAGGLVVTKYFTYTVGDNCSGTVTDTQAPTNFTATLGQVSSSSVELVLNASDDSGSVDYTIVYGGTTINLSGASGVQQSRVISGLTPSTPYSFSVTAKDASNNAASNNPIVINTTTLADTNTMCSGTSTQAQEFSFSTGYTYNFQTTGNTVNVTFKLLDTDKSGVVAFLRQQSPGFTETQMTPGANLTFTLAVTGLASGSSVNFAVKFAYAGGMVVTRYFTYTVGNNCVVTPADTQAPSNFTASLGTVTTTSAELLLNATDNSGSVNYTITYGGSTINLTGASGVQQSRVISGLTHSTAYNFTVTAKDAANNAAANNPIVVNATTLVDTNTACAGTSSQAVEGAFSTGYEYGFITVGTSVKATFKLLDTDKTGVVAYLRRETPSGEWEMAGSGLTFTYTLNGLAIGSTVKLAAKFAYGGGMSVTKYFTYTVGDTCGVSTGDTQAPTNFAATLGTVTFNSAEVLLTAVDDSGTVNYRITYGSTTIDVTGASGVQQSKVISGLAPETAYSFTVTARDAANNTAANSPVIVNATTLPDTSTACAGTSSIAAEGSFNTGYTYTFETSGNSVTATFTLLDTDKTGVVAYLWRQAPFNEWAMTHTSGLTFTKTVTGLAPGASVNFGVKFDYANGLSRTKYFTYTVGDNCGAGGEDTQAPTDFTAITGTVTSTSVELLLNATDDSGIVFYDITYGANSTSVTGVSGEQRSVVISSLTPGTQYSFTVTASDQAGNDVAVPVTVQAVTLPDSSTQCSGISSQAQQGSFSSGYNYDFETTGTDVTVTFTLLDTDKTGVVAILWEEEPFSEASMDHVSGLTFRKTLTNRPPGTTVTCAVKFAYSGGQSVTRYFTYLVGNNCDGSPLEFTTTWNGTSWSNGIPVSNMYHAVLQGDFDSAENGTITASSLTVNNGDVILAEGGNFVIKGPISVDNGNATLTIANNANLIQQDDVDNTGTIKVIKNSAPMYRLDYALWGSPVSGETLVGFSPQTLSNRFYRYNPVSNAYNPIAGTTVFEEGRGYLMRVANNHTAFVSDDVPGMPWTGTFTGIPNNGTIQVSVTPHAAAVEGGQNEVLGYNALGNPYPSPINIKDFYEANAAALGDDTSLYFWRKRNGAGYSTYASLTLMGYIANGQVIETEEGVEINYGDASNGQFSDPEQSDNWVINSGQGFIVQASSNTIVFNNSMRRGTNNGQIFSQPQSSGSRLWLNLKGVSNEFHQAMIAYTPAATTGLDFGFDGKAFTDGDIALWSLAGDNKLGIQARPLFDAADVVALGYKAATAGTYSIEVDHTDGVFAAGQQIYLKDNVTGLLHNFSQGGYSFTTEAGSIEGRFEVIYAMHLSTVLPVFDSNSIIAYKNDNGINISTGNMDMKSVLVYDIRGRLLYSSNSIDAPEVTVSGLSQQGQVLIIKVTAADGRIAVKKIVF